MGLQTYFAEIKYVYIRKFESVRWVVYNDIKLSELATPVLQDHHLVANSSSCDIAVSKQKFTKIVACGFTRSFVLKA